MNIELFLSYRQEPDDFDEYLDFDLPFMHNLTHLERYLDAGSFMNLNFCNGKKLRLHIHPDFEMGYEDILVSITSAKEGTPECGRISFCEQGVNFWLDYRLDGELIIIKYSKGDDNIVDNCNFSESPVTANRLVYVKEWEKVFDLFERAFKEKLGNVRKT